MGLRVVNAYINDDLNYVKLSKEIKILEAEALIVDKIKLRKGLEKAIEKYPETVGVSMTSNMLIRYLKENEKGQLKFEGIIWSGRTRLSGTYTIE